MNILITGANGFVGKHLAELAAEKKAVVFGTVTGKEQGKGLFEPINCDITKATEAENAVKKSNPEIVFHLAAQSSAEISWQKPLETFSINVLGTMNVLEAIRQEAPQAKIVFASSSECYGRIAEKQLPVKEHTPLKPVSPYALTKKIGEELLFFYNETHGIDYSIARFFNICGPGQREIFVISDWAKQLAGIEAKKGNLELLVGRLDVWRDFLDVRDAVRALWRIAEADSSQKVFNVCSGKPVQLKSVLEKLLSLSGQKISFSVDEKKIRKTDTRKSFGSNSMLRKTTGWKQEINIEQSLKDVFEHWKKSA